MKYNPNTPKKQSETCTTCACHNSSHDWETSDPRKGRRVMTVYDHRIEPEKTISSFPEVTDDEHNLLDNRPEIVTEIWIVEGIPVLSSREQITPPYCVT